MTKALLLFAYHAATTALLVLMTASVVSAQSARNPSDELLRKCDPWLKHHLFLESITERRTDSVDPVVQKWLSPVFDSEIRLDLFISGNPATMPDLLRQHGGEIGSVTGSIATVSIPLDSLEALAVHPEIWRLELAVPVETTQDTVRRHVHADEVHQGRPPLQKGLTGKGVIVGVIDTGIDFRHPEFLNSDGSTRILSLVDLSAPGGRTPDGLDRGSEWRREAIDADLRGDSTGLVTARDPMGHGTHVSGIAAGRSGIAPEADLIVVQSTLEFETLTTYVLDAASYIYRLASAEGKPCVINASLGTPLHFHDGSDALSRGVASLLDESPHRIFVAAAGNDGWAAWHWGGFPAEADSLWVYSHAGTTWIRLADSLLDLFEISVQVDASHAQGGSWQGKLGQSSWRSAGAISSAPGFVDRIQNSTIAVSASSLGNGHSGIIIDIGESDTGPAAYYRILVRGRGVFHAWNSGFHDIPVTTGDQYNRFRSSSSEMQTGSPGVEMKVITVGSYSSRSQYVDVGGNRHMAYTQVRELSPFSSRGPRSDGLFKPDIVAPGQYVFSARSSAMTHLSESDMLSDSLYFVGTGTSMAAPVVTGAVALYLQLFPDATLDQVRSAIYQSAAQDAFTRRAGPQPNSAWGMGKLDVFRMLTGVAAHAPGISPQGTSAPIIWSRPLPAHGEVVLEHDGTLATDGTLYIYNQLGREVHRAEMQTGDQQILLDVSGWPAGIYHCLISSAYATAVGRIIVGR